MWWDDKETQQNQNRAAIKYVLPIFLFSIFLFSMLLWKVSFLQFFSIVLTWSLMLYTFINIFIQAPHTQIPSHYSKSWKTIMYIFHFLLAFFLFYLVSVGILQHYYEPIKKLVCCNIVKNFPLF